MKQLTKSILNKTELGKKLLSYIRIKRCAFKSASEHSFSPLNKLFRKTQIDLVYTEAFNKIFILANSFGLTGDVLEFGVYQGYSALFLAKKIKQFGFKDTNIHLFDSFIGLPNAKDLDNCSYEFRSGTWVKGSMAVPCRLEKYIQKKIGNILSKNRVKIVKGYFEDTLTDYIKYSLKSKARLVHLDCDLYSSSKFVLEQLINHEVIQDGTIFIFDDWMTSRGNPNLGQRKAFQDVLASNQQWSFENFMNYGVGSYVFIAHDLRIAKFIKI